MIQSKSNAAGKEIESPAASKVTIPEDLRNDIMLIPGFLADPQAIFQKVISESPWQGDMKSRGTASFGVPYLYSHVSYPEREMASFLQPLIDPISRAAGFTPNNCLINYYADGSNSMGFHSDDIRAIAPGTGVVILTLGAERTLRFRKIEDHSATREMLLPNGSLFLMSRELQDHWQHAVPKDPTCTQARISLTFRNIPPA